MPSRRTALVVAVFLALVLATGPFGEFPQDDDFSFALAVRRLLDEGAFRPTDWTAMTLVTHTLWGALFCLPAGFSFAALRLSTVVAGAVAVGLTERLATRSGAGARTAVAAALTVAACPLFLALATTFMTDVLFVALALSAVAAFLRGAGADGPARTRWLVAGALLSVAATLTRQVGVTVPLSFALLMLVRDGRRGLRWLVPAAVTIAALAAFLALLDATGRAPALLSLGSDRLRDAWIAGRATPVALVERTGIALTYLGLFTAPVLLVTRGAGGRVHARLIGAATALAACAFRLLRVGDWLPIAGHVLRPYGVGHPGLRDVAIDHLPHLAAAPDAVRVALTLLGVAGATALAARLAPLAVDLLRRPRATLRDARRLPAAACLVTAVVSFAPFGLAAFVDRYLLLLVPLLLVALLDGDARPAGRARTAAALAALTLLAVFSVAATHDRLARSRARWELLDRLTARGVRPDEIDGGLEFNGYTLIDRDFSGHAKDGRSWWWVWDDRFRLTYGPMDGYREVDRLPWNSWLPGPPGSVRVLERR